MRCAQKVSAGTDVLDGFKDLLKVVVAGSLTEMIEGIQLLKVDDGFGLLELHLPLVRQQLQFR